MVRIRLLYVSVMYKLLCHGAAVMPIGRQNVAETPTPSARPVALPPTIPPPASVVTVKLTNEIRRITLLPLSVQYNALVFESKESPLGRLNSAAVPMPSARPAFVPFAPPPVSVAIMATVPAPPQAPDEAVAETLGEDATLTVVEPDKDALANAVDEGEVCFDGLIDAAGLVEALAEAEPDAVCKAEDALDGANDGDGEALLLPLPLLLLLLGIIRLRERDWDGVGVTAAELDVARVSDVLALLDEDAADEAVLVALLVGKLEGDTVVLPLLDGEVEDEAVLLALLDGEAEDEGEGQLAAMCAAAFEALSGTSTTRPP